MKKIKSGIYGLNRLLDGGINLNSTNVVIGAAGTGKTTLATQFIRRGLEADDYGIFISLDENQDQIINQAIEMGWEDISKYIEKGKLVFIDASGKKFSEYIVDELPEFVEKWQGGVTSRIVIDPLTPVIWAVKDQYEQRELMCLLLRELRKIGTVLCTLEEHGTIGNLSGNEAVIPMYLADCVIHLKYKKGDDTVCGVLKIIKCRNSRHSRKFHAYDIIRGLGVVIIEHNYSRKSGDDRVRESSKSLLKSKLSKLPPLQRKYIDHVLKNLTSTDLKSIELHELISDILEEYESEL